mmetsp:Transcript_46475/g.86898  ORF Transcript_46475/g.86898 Transcript_46475/m.86898 type:complete len:116 (+) Transcript_46475:48-395(+)
MSSSPASLPTIMEGLVKDEAAAKRVMAKLMNSLVRAHIEDGRIISGQLWCFDQLRNLILLSGFETRVDQDGQQQHRSLGPLVMVPGKHILKLEATKPATEAAAAEASREEPTAAK